MDVLVEAHAINAYAYCPRRCYYEYVEGVFYHNAYTIHGKLLHERVDRFGRELRGNGKFTVPSTCDRNGWGFRCGAM